MEKKGPAHVGDIFLAPGPAAHKTGTESNASPVKRRGEKVIEIIPHNQQHA